LFAGAMERLLNNITQPRLSSEGNYLLQKQ
jgi:hypothetical protein